MTTLKPAVSICCIAYNQESYIRDCLEGFIMQKTNFPFEVLIHDDASTDKTADIIREYEARYPDFIKPIYQTENQYSQGARINLVYNFPRVRGKYIAICEGDDYWTDPEKLQVQFDFMEANPEYSMCFHRVCILNEQTGEESLSCNADTKDISLSEAIFCSGELIPTASTFFRSKWITFLTEFQSGCPVGDYARQIALAKVGKIYCSNRVMATYRSLATGSWSANWAKNKNRDKLLGFYKKMYYWLCNTREKYNLPNDAIAPRIGQQYFHILWLTQQYDAIKKDNDCRLFLKTLPLRARWSIYTQLYGLRKKKYLAHLQ